jgi:outer membrane protein assembly factor BamB
VLPTRQPIVVGDTVVVRSLADVTALDRRTGRFLWRQLPDFFVAKLLPADGQESAVTGWKSDLGNRVQANVWYDTTYGRLSSDGERVYALETPDTFPEPPQKTRLPQQRANVLTAYELAEGEGRCVWQVGGESGVGPFELPLAGRFFLGPPLALGGELYCVCEHGTEVELLVLDARTGEERWSQPLAAADGNPADPTPRHAGAVVAAADGILVCPTATGTVVAVELSTRSLLWAYAASRPDVVGMEFRRGGILLNGQPVARSSPVGWADGTPVIADGRVLLTLPSSSELHCLNLLDGSLVWKKPREDGLYVAGVADKRVVVVGAAHVRAYALDDGANPWKQDVSISSRPSGLGLVDGDCLLLPSGERLVTIDLQGGEITANETVREGVPLGNLVAAGPQLLSQSTDHVFAFPRPKRQP